MLTTREFQEVCQSCSISLMSCVSVFVVAVMNVVVAPRLPLYDFSAVSSIWAFSCYCCVPRRQLSQTHTSADLRACLRPHKKTVCRWLAWWRDIVPGTRFWTHAKGLFMPTLNSNVLCDELVEVFSATHSSAAIHRLLRFISPLSCFQDTVSDV